MESSARPRQPWPMFCVHLLVVASLLAVAGPATNMPQLLTTALIGVALLALCSPVPYAVTVALAVCSGLLLELAYSVIRTDPDPAASALRVSLLVVCALGTLAFRRRRAKPQSR